MKRTKTYWILVALAEPVTMPEADWLAAALIDRAKDEGVKVQEVGAVDESWSDGDDLANQLADGCELLWSDEAAGAVLPSEGAGAADTPAEGAEAAEAGAGGAGEAA